jgi:MTH538 TIR-like domain (DUF1863)
MKGAGTTMANRTGTYFAFDGLGETDPSKSDFKYYATVQSWDAHNHIEFRFVNSHEKASSVRDTSSLETLKASIRQRLDASKNMVVILSDQTRKTGSLLSYEIEKAVDTHSLPLIIAYPGYNSILKPAELWSIWPNVLYERISNATAKAIHIPFKKDAILEAISQFTINSGNLNNPLEFYNRETQVGWGYISP